MFSQRSGRYCSMSGADDSPARLPPRRARPRGEFSGMIRLLARPRRVAPSPIAATGMADGRCPSGARPGSPPAFAVLPRELEALHALVVARGAVPARGHPRPARLAPVQRLRRRRARLALALLDGGRRAGDRVARAGMVGPGRVHEAGGRPARARLRFHLR